MPTVSAPTGAAGSLDVRAIQRALNADGARLAEDGEDGPATRAAIYGVVQARVGGVAASWPRARLRIAYEQMMLRDAGLYAGAIDGVAGPQTRAALAKWSRPELVVPVDPPPPAAPPSFAGLARRITEVDIVAAARAIGCEVAALHAVMSVESRGSGFDGRGRPVILFEPHVFYRNLSGDDLHYAIMLGVAYPKWGTRPYPKTSDGNYARLELARKVNNEAAFRSVSIGLGQILGENFEKAGHASAGEMFVWACASEANQLGQMVAFIKSNHLDGYLRAKNWAAFAAGYNGPGYARNDYDDKLATAYRRAKSGGRA